jgi:hypothetical protein
LFLINIKSSRLRHQNQEVKTEKPEQLAPSPHLLLDVKVQEKEDIEGLPGPAPLGY